MIKIYIFKFIFILVGIGLLLGSFFTFRSTSSFLNGSTNAEGTVVKLNQSRANNNNSITYTPVVRFINQNNESIEFISAVSSNPPSYAIGQKDEVLYRPENPQKAQINSFFSLWGVSFILGVMGLVFSLIGFAIIFAKPMKTTRSRQEEFLMKNGTLVITEFKGVELDTTILVKGNHPFRVLTQWQNPFSSELHLFKSNNVWFDPSIILAGKKIRVFIDKTDPDVYYVDLAHLTAPRNNAI